MKLMLIGDDMEKIRWFFSLFILTVLWSTVCAEEGRHRFQDCETCPEMVLIPSGVFSMGSRPNEPRAGDDEHPQHEVTISYVFALGAFEVTFNQWDACVDGGGCDGYVPDDNGWGRGNLPVINVSWEDAQRYVEWLQRKTGRAYRLPTESEWEYAARGGTTSYFWWGDKFDREMAACDGCTIAGQRIERQPRIVGSYPANPFGLYDVHGNVWEWVQDCWHSHYMDHPEDGSAWLPSKECTRRVLRGGSWSTNSAHLRSANRSWKGPSYRGPRDHGKGFRVAVTVKIEA